MRCASSGWRQLVEPGPVFLQASENAARDAESFQEALSRECFLRRPRISGDINVFNDLGQM